MSLSQLRFEYWIETHSSVQYTVYIVHFTVYNIHCTIFTYNYIHLTNIELYYYSVLVLLHTLLSTHSTQCIQIQYISQSTQIQYISQSTQIQCIAQYKQIQYIAQYTQIQYTVYNTMYDTIQTVKCTIHNVQCTIQYCSTFNNEHHTLHFTVYTTLYKIHYTIHYTLPNENLILCTWWIQHSLHSWPPGLHPHSNNYSSHGSHVITCLIETTW